MISQTAMWSITVLTSRHQGLSFPFMAPAVCLYSATVFVVCTYYSTETSFVYLISYKYFLYCLFTRYPTVLAEECEEHTIISFIFLELVEYLGEYSQIHQISSKTVSSLLLSLHLVRLILVLFSNHCS